MIDQGSTQQRRTSRRRGLLLRALLVAGLATGLVATTSQIANAASWSRDKVAVPSSVIGSLDNATAAERARMVGNVVPTDANRLPDGRLVAPRVPVSVPVPSLLKAGGAFAASLSGLSLGWQIGAGVASLAGYDSNAALAELTGIGRVPEYVPDGDWVASEVTGWVPTSTIVRDGVQMSVGVPTPGWVHMADAVQTQVFPVEFDSRPAQVDFGYQCFYVKADGSPGAANMNAGSTVSAAPWLSLTRSFSCEQTYTATDAATGVSYTGFLDHVIARNPADSAQTIVYYPVGHAERPPDVSASPERRWELRYSCSGGPGGVVHSEFFRESDEGWPDVPAGDCAGAGEVDSLELWLVSPEAPETDVLIDSWTASDAVRDWRTAFPECQTAACTLELLRIDQATTVSCFSDPAACVDWWTTPEPTRSERYECRYADTVVPLAECAVYAPTFNRHTGTDVLVTNPDGTTKRVPADSVLPHADPKTGEPVQADEPSPAPGTGTQPDGCPPDFNIKDALTGYWAYKATTCALAWAFIPTETGAALDKLADTAATRTPVPQISSAATWLNPPQDAQPACIVLDLDATAVPIVDGDLRTFDSCDPTGFTGWLHDNRWLTGIALWAGFVMPLVWWAWRQYAPGATGVA